MPKRSWTIGALGLSAAALLSCSGEVTYADGAAGSAGTGQVKEYSCQDNFQPMPGGDCPDCLWKDRLCICDKDPARREPDARDVPTCSTESVAGGICCKDEDSCSCYHWGCKVFDGTCYCDGSLMFIYAPPECDKSWAHCCANRDAASGALLMCTCQNGPCEGAFVEVPSCSPELLTCGKSERVERCQ